MKDRIEELYRPNAITRDLMTNEDEINKVKESDKNKWDYVFADSVEDREKEHKVKYRMRDADTPATYETESDYYDPTTIQIETEITGKKIWLEDTVESRPELITVYLLADGETIKEQIVTARTKWAYRFTNIPMYDELGEKIIYLVKEKPVVSYQTIYEGYNIINLRKDTSEDTEDKEEVKGLTTSRATRIGLFVLGAAAITAGLLLDQVRKEE